jgi:nitric oxide reductase NorQ protein
MNSDLLKFETPKPELYLIKEDGHKALIEVIRKRQTRGEIVNVLITGKQGTGKSKFCEQYAAQTKSPYAVLEIGLLGDPRQIFGYTILKDGKTEFVKGLFTEAITTPNCVIHLQEINRPESDRALNAIFSVLDATQRKVWIDELGQYVKVASGVVFFATLNEGYEFVGTIPLDAALKSRFSIKLALDVLDPNSEISLLQSRCGLSPESANEIIAVAGKIREANLKDKEIYVSTRDILNIGELVRDGLDNFLAFKTVLGHDADTQEFIRLAMQMMRK